MQQTARSVSSDGTAAQKARRCTMASTKQQPSAQNPSTSIKYKTQPLSSRRQACQQAAPAP